MKVKNQDKYSNAEKIILAGQIWDNTLKKDVGISGDAKRELDKRLQKLEEGKTRLYSWEEVLKHLSLL